MDTGGDVSYFITAENFFFLKGTAYQDSHSCSKSLYKDPSWPESRDWDWNLEKEDNYAIEWTAVPEI